MYSEHVRTRLQDVVEYSDRAASYLGEMSLAEFRADHRTLHAVERCVACITEAVIQIGEDEAGRIWPHVPFRLVRGMGNRLRHEYKGIDARAVYETVHGELPALRADAAQALGN
jgi:uncharacterized protein with HEPN domain